MVSIMLLLRPGTAILVVLIAAILALLCDPVQKAVEERMRRRPALLWMAAATLIGVFWTAASWSASLSAGLAGLVTVYALLPVACAWMQRKDAFGEPTLLDFTTIALIWLPLEFAAGASLVPRPAQGYLHSIAYGVAILLGLLIFACFRQAPGLKYNLPRARRDVWLPLIAYLLVAPVLILLGVAIGFIPPFHASSVAPFRMAAAFPIVFLGTALPEEILFRSLIQNFLMRRLGDSWRVLLLASIIFGAAHLDNGPQPAPNWRYMILATIAGVAYGRVFQRATSVCSPALLHTLVDWTKHYYF